MTFEQFWSEKFGGVIREVDYTEGMREGWNGAVETAVAVAAEEAEYQRQLAESQNADFVDGEQLATRIRDSILKLRAQPQ